MANPRRRFSPRSLNLVLGVASAALLMVVALLARNISSASASTTACALSEMSGAGQSSCWHPFAATSPFNTELPSNPMLAADNAAVQQHMETYGWSLDGSNSSFALSGDGTRPVYFASPSDPVMTIHCADEYGPNSCQDANHANLEGTKINVPVGAQPDSNWDAHMTVIETATGEEYDLWHSSVSGSTLTAGTGSEESTDANGLQGGGNAANFALTAGLLRPSELLSGQINHALVIGVPCTNASGANVGYTWPASGGWGEYCGQYWNETASNAPELGQLVKLNLTDAQIANSGAPVWQQTIMTALAHYGAYIEDTNGSWHNEGMYIETQDPASWTDLGQTDQWTAVAQQLGGQNSTLTSNTPIPTSQLVLVDTCVTQGTCPNASGPITPPPVATPPTITPVGTPPGPVLSGLPTRSSSEPTKARDAPRQSGPSRAPTRRTTSARAARAREAWVRHESKRAHRSRRQRHAAHHHPRRGHRRREGHRIRGGRRR